MPGFARRTRVSFFCCRASVKAEPPGISIIDVTAAYHGAAKPRRPSHAVGIDRRRRRRRRRRRGRRRRRHGRRHRRRAGQRNRRQFRSAGLDLNARRQVEEHELQRLLLRRSASAAPCSRSGTASPGCETVARRRATTCTSVNTTRPHWLRGRRFDRRVERQVLRRLTLGAVVRVLWHPDPPPRVGRVDGRDRVLAHHQRDLAARRRRARVHQPVGQRRPLGERRVDVGGDRASGRSLADADPVGGRGPGRQPARGSRSSAGGRRRRARRCRRSASCCRGTASSRSSSCSPSHWSMIMS